VDKAPTLYPSRRASPVLIHFQNPKWGFGFANIPPARLQSNRPDVNPQGEQIKTQKLVYLAQVAVSGHIPPRFPPANQRLGGPAEQKRQGILVQTTLDPFKP
jgi:hypothetical protein